MSFPQASTWLEIATPVVFPGTGKQFIYPKADGLWYTMDDAGVETALSAASGAPAPATATYLTQTADAGLSAEQALSSLATGLMKVTTATGVVTSVTTSAGLAALISDETGSGALVFATSPTLVTPVLGVAAATSLTVGSTANTPLNAYSDGVAAIFVLTSYNGSGSPTTSGATVRQARAQGSLAVPATVVNGDTIGAFTFQAYDGTAMRTALVLTVVVSNTPGASSIPSTLTFEAIQNVGDTSRREFFRFGGTAVVVNDDSRDIDFRVEGDTDASLFVTDASTDRAGVGTATPATKLHVLLTDSGTNAVVNVATLQHIGGTVAAGFGTGLLLTAEDSTTPDVSIARLRSLYTTVTHASYATRSVLSAFDFAAERDVIGWGASGTAALLGFHDKATAPVAQSAGWAVTNPVSRKTYDTTTITLPELAEVVGTIITYLISRGDFAA